MQTCFRVTNEYTKRQLECVRRGIRTREFTAKPYSVETPNLTGRFGNRMESCSVHDLEVLIEKIEADLSTKVANETIHCCGKAPVAIISSRPEDVLQLAYQQLNAMPYADVKEHWRRLHEEASLHQVIAILRGQVPPVGDRVNHRKRPRLEDESLVTKCGISNWIDDVIVLLDRSIMISGCPGRRTVFDAVFQQLQAMLPDKDVYNDDMPDTYKISCALRQLPSVHQIARYKIAIGLEAFHDQLQKAEPCIIPQVMEYWPALDSWQNPRYLLRLTLGGRRLVPVEVGQSYTEEGWAQRIMPMHEFLTTYVLPDSPAAVGYLAQHDLFEQLPELKSDIITPDYCYTSPPAVGGHALKTAGLSSVKQLDEPLRNAWFGPKGTKTPLHTDPYHNILCQVVGYKYVRLYAPSQTSKLYARGMDENGISMENTSRIDISLVRPELSGVGSDHDARAEQESRFPMFTAAQYVETVLGPGESLYIPVGWWHYVESLSTSFSVSFWWN
nr:lysine-specific demethylase 8 [Quercus suber]